MAKIGRDGRVPKSFIGADIPAHPGMQFKRAIDGQTFVGISPTQAAHPLDDEPNVTDAKLPGKHFLSGQNVPVHPSMQGRTRFGVSKGNADGSAILNESALKVGK